MRYSVKHGFVREIVKENTAMTATFLDKAAKLLPSCKTLADAEAQLGGAFEHGARINNHLAAEVWGLLDGWQNRPRPEQLALADVSMTVYVKAWEEGRRLRLREVSG